ncbi:MAG: ribbon-helix-helix domain-containing protein [Acidipropionibacterium sp.]|jgi:plasmid stability protein|nr:ribbon-helix-helix domain-containing protein [Acidipropionibacterium sp.]
MGNRNLTISLPDDLVHRAKVFAAEHDTSVSALVRDLLADAVERGRDGDRWGAEEELMRRGDALRVGPADWSRDELHAR